jgi:hypothetical protein
MLHLVGYAKKNTLTMHGTMNVENPVHLCDCTNQIKLWIYVCIISASGT